jgi:membrane protease YdiL (CAAX protease family)
MRKALLLYLLAFAVLSLANWQPALNWLASLALLALLAGVLLLWRSERRAIRDLGLRKTKFWLSDLGTGLCTGLLLPVALLLLLAISGSLKLVATTWPVPLLVGIVGGIAVGVLKTALTVSVEEVVFRGYFLQRFRVDLGTTYAVLLSSFLFSLMHAPAMLGSGLSLMSLLIGLASWFVFGIALSIGFLRTGSSLWFPWGLHYAYNLFYSLVGFGIAAIYHAPAAILYAGSVWWVGNPAWAPESGLLGLLLEGALLAAVWVVTGVRLHKDERRTGELPISNV